MTATTAAPPANVKFGTVRGRFIVGIDDGDDAGAEPDYIPAAGEIAFTPSVPYVPNPGAPGGPVTMLKTRITGTLDAEGYLCTRKPDGSAGARGVMLAATDDPAMLVRDWTWQVAYKLRPVNGVSLTIDSHGIAVPAGQVIDLTTTLKVPSSSGYGVPQAEAAALRAEAALAAALEGGGGGGGAQLPAGGTAGQVLTKTTMGEAWSNAPTGIPAGGTAGQVLTKTAAGESWSNVPTEIPDGGSAGQTLMRTATGVGWGTPEAAGPPGGMGSTFLHGPGRPDHPWTTAGIITGSEPAGTTYASTDGAGVGAGQWIKTESTALPWQVSVGNTGYRFYSEGLVLADPAVSLSAKGMRNHGVTYNRTATGASVELRGEVITDNPWFEIPSGFEPSSSVVLNVYEDGGVDPLVWQFNVAYFHGRRWFHNMHPTVNPLRAGKSIVVNIVYTVNFDAAWPTTLGGVAS